MKSIMRTAVMALPLAAIAALPASAEELVLKFATTNFPQAHLNVQIQHPWAKRLNEQGAGVLKIDVRDGPAVANHANFYQRVVDDVVQISWGVNSFVSGKFPRTEVVSLPYLAPSSEAASVALRRLFKEGLLDAEYNEVVPLRFVGFPQAGLHLKAQPVSTEDLQGLKVQAGGRMPSQIVAALGGAPISLNITEIYEGIQRGTVNGTIIQWTAFQPFKLAEVTKYHIDTGFGGAPAMVFMATKRYQALPDAVRRIIDANSGEKDTREFGQFWDRVQHQGRETVRAAGGHTIVKPTPAVEAKWRERLQPLAEEWTKTVPNGARLLARYRAILKEVQGAS
jgi:TRAP-type C4-dicarboxylate transport system substrate-binding protein